VSEVTTVKAPRKAVKGGVWKRMGVSTAYAVGLPVALLVIWGVWATVDSPKFFPSPARIFTAFIDTWIKDGGPRART